MWVYIYDIDVWYLPMTALLILGEDMPAELIPDTKISAAWDCVLPL